MLCVVHCKRDRRIHYIINNKDVHFGSSGTDNNNRHHQTEAEWCVLEVVIASNIWAG